MHIGRANLCRFRSIPFATLAQWYLIFVNCLSLNCSWCIDWHSLCHRLLMFCFIDCSCSVSQGCFRALASVGYCRFAHTHTTLCAFVFVRTTYSTCETQLLQTRVSLLLVPLRAYVHCRVSRTVQAIVTTFVALQALAIPLIAHHSSLVVAIKALLVLFPIFTLCCNDDVNSDVKSIAVFASNCIWARWLSFCHSCLPVIQLSLWAVCVCAGTASLLRDLGAAVHTSVNLLDPSIEWPPSLRLVVAIFQLATLASHAIPLGYHQQRQLLAIGCFATFTQLMDVVLNVCCVANTQDLDASAFLTFSIVFVSYAATMFLPMCGSCVLCAIGCALSSFATIFSLCFASQVTGCAMLQ